MPLLCEEHSYLVWQRQVATLATIGWIAAQRGYVVPVPRAAHLCVDCGGSFPKRSKLSAAPLEDRAVAGLRKTKAKRTKRCLGICPTVRVEMNVPSVTEDDFGIFSIAKLQSLEAEHDMSTPAPIASADTTSQTDFGPDVRVAKLSDKVLTAELVIDVEKTETLEDVELFLAAQESTQEKRKGIQKVVRFGRVDTRDFEKDVDEDRHCIPFLGEDHDFVLESLENNESIGRLVEYIPPTVLECVSFKEAAGKVGEKLTQPFGALRDAVWGAMLSNSDSLEGKMSSDSTVASELGSDDDAASWSPLERTSSFDEKSPSMSAFAALEHKLSLLGI